MGAEAVIRVRLDLDAAEQDLERLYGKLRNAPGVSVPGGGRAPAPATPPGGGGGGGGSGTDMAPILRRLGALFGAQQLIGASAGAGLQMGRDELREALLGPAFGSARGALASREAVAGRFGKAYQLGLVDDDFLGQMFEFEQQFGAGASTKGSARARQALSGDVVNAVGSDAAGLAAAAVPYFEEISTTLKSILGKLGG